MVAVILSAACLTVFLVIVYFIHKHISYDLIVSDLERVEDYIGDSLRFENTAPRTQGKEAKRASFVRHGKCEGVSLPITKDASPGSCQLGYKYGGQAYIQSPPPATATTPHMLSVYNTTDFLRRWEIAQQLVGVNTTVFDDCPTPYRRKNQNPSHHHHQGRRRGLEHIHRGRPHVHVNHHQYNQHEQHVGQAEDGDGAHWHGHGNVHGNLNSQHAGHGHHNNHQHHQPTHHPHTRAHHHPLSHVAHVDCGKPVTSLIRLWLYTSHGVCVPTDYKVIYFRNYKVANDMIRFSLDPKAKAHGCEFHYGNSALFDPSYCSFSFVRHPFDRFVSGYSEAERRWLMLRMRSIEQRTKIEERRKAERKAKKEDGAEVHSDTHGEGTKTTVSDGAGSGTTNEDQKTSAQKDEEERMLNEKELYDKLTEAEKHRKEEEEEEEGDEDEEEQDRAHAHRIEKMKNKNKQHPVLPYSSYPNVPGRLDPTLEAAPGEEIGTTNRALAFVRSLLHLEWLSPRPTHNGRPRSMPTGGEIQKWWRHDDAILHVFPQAGVFAEHGIDFMGHFESFNNDWDAMQRYCNFTFGGKMDHNMKKQRTKAEHPTGSSHDELGTYKAMRTLIETNAHVARALCHILYYDFVYFGYSFPPACSDMATPP